MVIDKRNYVHNIPRWRDGGLWCAKLQGRNTRKTMRPNRPNNGKGRAKQKIAPSKNETEEESNTIQENKTMGIPNRNAKTQENLLTDRAKYMQPTDTETEQSRTNPQRKVMAT